MTAKIQRLYPMFFLLAASLLLAAELWITTLPEFTASSGIFPAAVTFDITIGLPFLYYLFFVRTRFVPAITLVPVFVLSVVVAGILLPSSQQLYLDYVRWVLPLAELLVVVYAISKIRRIIRAVRQNLRTDVYTVDAVEKGLRQVLGNSAVIPLAASEISLLYYAFAGWFLKFDAPGRSARVFSCHRRSGYGAIIVVLIMVMIVEISGVHFLLSQWDTTTAWILTAVSLYSLLWILGDYQAVRLQPVVFRDSMLHLRTGLRWGADIHRQDIVSIERARPADAELPGYISIAVIGKPNVTVRLARPVAVRGLLGRRKEARVIGIFVDDADQFVRL